MSEKTEYDVIVIGAGLAGISAAKTLFLNGFKDVLVLEAQSEVGGRIKTEIVNDFPLDYGAQFVHGEVGNPLYEFGLRHNLFLNLPPFDECDGNYYTECGIRVDPDAVDDIEKLVEVSIHEPEIIASENVQEIFDLAKKEVHRDIRLEGLLEWHKNYHLVDNPAHRLDELSVEAWNQYQETPGNYCQLVKGGFISIVNQMMKAIPKDMVQCNKPVETIFWKGDSINSDKPGVVIRLKDGKEYRCQHVIVTCSIGYLREHLTDFFQPNLPQLKLDAFKGIGFGSITKIALFFEEPFWEGHCKGFTFAWTDTHLGHALNYKEPWYHYLSGFDVIQASNPAILMGWVGAKGALHLAQTDPADDDLGAECAKVLADFLGFPSIPKPFRTIRTRWHVNPYTRGAYSYRTGPFEPHLLDPMGPIVDGHKFSSLMFAGEALHPVHINSAHGAFASGKEQALKLIEWKKNHQNQLNGNHLASTTPHSA